MSDAIRRDPEPPRFLSQAGYEALLDRVYRLMRQAVGPQTSVGCFSAWRGGVRWGRNRILMASDWRDVAVNLNAYCDGNGHTNQVDEASLRGMVELAEYGAQRYGTLPGLAPAAAAFQPHESRMWPTATIWSDATFAQTDDTRLEIAERLIASAEAAGMLSAGYLSVSAQGNMVALDDRRVEYVPQTLAQCSITVRMPDGSASGWAGRSSFAWGRLDAEHLAATALEKCLTSRNPVRIEPGRYTLIMEPQATFGLMSVLFLPYAMDGGLIPSAKPWNMRSARHEPDHVFHDARRGSVAVSAHGDPEPVLATKIGQRVFDARISLSWDPKDPDLGVVPYWPNAMLGNTPEVYPKEAVQWVTNGVLTALGYPPGLTVTEMRDWIGDIGHTNGVLYTGSGFRMDGGTTTIEEMIATTERGLLVTRFANRQVTQLSPLMISGTTRDGLWLIERGRITHAAKNLRWTESPWFVFNQVEQIGQAVPIFAPDAPPALAPPVKVRDFNFSGLENSI